jgi:hypothetical protein
MRWTRAASRARGGRRAGFRERYTARRRTALLRTGKSCGPGTRCWCQVSRRRTRPDRASDVPFNPRGDGGKKELVAGEITYNL